MLCVCSATQGIWSRRHSNAFSSPGSRRNDIWLQVQARESGPACHSLLWWYDQSVGCEHHGRCEYSRFLTWNSSWSFLFLNSPPPPPQKKTTKKKQPFLCAVSAVIARYQTFAYMYTYIMSDGEEHWPIEVTWKAYGGSGPIITEGRSSFP